MANTSASLLDRACRQGGDDAWRQLVDLYTPLVRGWLRRHGLADSDGDDLVQEVLAVVVRRLPQFEHNGRPGAFRTWLRSITVNCLRDFWRAQRLRPRATGDSDFLQVLHELEDPDSGPSREWDREHDLHVTRQLLQQIQPHFATPTWRAFQRVTLDGAPPDQVAAELGISVNAVFIAKSRVLARLRQEAAGLIDGPAGHG